MTKIKDLTHRAVELLEMAYFSSPLDAPPSSIPRTPASGALAMQHRELITFCKSARLPGALVLANVVSQLALERRIPSVVVTARCSPVVFVLTLLLWRAGIALEEAVAPGWCEHEFAQLTVAAREVASAPLLVMSATSSMAVSRMVLTTAANRRTCWIITDAGTDPFRQFEKVRCEPGVSITIVSFTRGRLPA